MPYKDLEKRLEFHREYMREWRKKPENQEREKEYRQNPVAMAKAREGTRRYKEAHKDELNAKRRRTYAKNTKAYHEMRLRCQQYLGGVCVECGEDCPVCLDFHHIDPAEKEFVVCAKISKGWLWDRLQPELDKCVLLCRNCHAVLHWGSMDDYNQYNP